MSRGDLRRAVAMPTIAAYVASGEWQGKAGAYAIQGRAQALHRASVRQLFRGDGPAVVRDRAACCAEFGPSHCDRERSAHERRNPGQRHPARNPRRRGRERHAAGAAHRARQRAAAWSATSTRARCSGSCRACRRRSSRSAWTARRSCTPPTSCALHVAALSARATRRRLPPRRRAPISELVRDGQDIVVQVVKDPIGSKGARLTTQLQHSVALPRAAAASQRARRLGAHRGRSRARAAEGTGRRTAPAAHGSYGYIVRTNAEGQPREALAEDIAYLGRAWALVAGQHRATRRSASCVYEDLQPAAARGARPDAPRRREGARSIRAKPASALRAFAAQFMPELAEQIEHYTGERPIFDLYGVEDEIQRALREGSAAEVRRLPGHRPDRGDDHGRRQHRFVPRPAQPRGNRLPHQPRSGAGGRAPAAPAQPRRHHHHRLHRHDRRRAPAPGAAHAGEIAGARPRQDHGVRLLAAGPGRDDAQAHDRMPRAPAVRALPRMRRPRHAQDRGNGDLRNLPRDHARGAPVRGARGCW